MINKIDYYIKDHYGSKKGLMHLSISKVRNLLGSWNQYKNIEWQKVDSLVFMCMGNICRSPLGEIIAQKHGVNTRSCGLTAPEGDPADPRAIQFASQFDMDLSQHTTTPIQNANLSETDLVIAMEPQHFLHENFPQTTAQKTLLGLWHESPKAYLHDPYNTSEQYFQRCETMVLEATENIINILNQHDQ